MPREHNAEGLDRFVERHELDERTRVRELLEALRTKRVALHARHVGASCSELTGTYRVRSRIAESQGKHELAAEMENFASACEASTGQTCTVWVFSGEESSFIAFEFEPSAAVAWCAKLPGPIERHPESAA
jgi:hypothetical protein